MRERQRAQAREEEISLLKEAIGTGSTIEEAKEQARLRFETWCENLSASGTVLEDTQLTVTVEDGICRSTGLVQATESIAVRGEP